MEPATPTNSTGTMDARRDGDEHDPATEAVGQRAD